jgi:threonine aldolase
MINLKSDTVTKPTTEMLQHMLNAEVGDDVFGEDPTVNQLERKVANMFGKEAALFCPSGTMTNQIAIKINTQPLDEIICDHYSHVYQYETAGYAYNSSVGINLIQGTNGKISAEQIESAIKDDHDWLPNSKLVVLENSCNKGGGSYYTLDEIKPIQNLCKANGLRLHLDGARLFNVLVETEEDTNDVGALFDTISICLSKGLGAPIGSLLIGNKEDIKRARKFRKVMGGGMRQAGYLAAAGLYALDHHVSRLKEDNDRAKYIGEIIADQSYVESVRPVKTNIVIFSLRKNIVVKNYLAYLEKNQILAVQFGPQEVRFVFHLDITASMVEKIANAVKSFTP